MSTVRERIDCLSLREPSPCRNILYIDQLHGRQLFLDGYRHRRQFQKHNAIGEKIRNYAELTLVVAASFLLFSLLVWVCV